MNRRLDPWCGLAAALAVLAFFLPPTGAVPGGWLDHAPALLGAMTLIAAAAHDLWPARRPARHGAALLAGAGLAALLSLPLLHALGTVGLGFWSLAVAIACAAWSGIELTARLEPRTRAGRRARDLLVPAAFGLLVLYLWEAATVGFGIPSVLLPAPSAIAARFAASIDIIAADVAQTFLRAVLAGYAIGCLAGLAVAILVDRSPFMQRGLLPFGNLMSALPIVGIAPIMVMWFGFDWPSKAAVVVLMTFFPMLVNALTGLRAADRLERDLLRSYAAGYWQSLVKLRLPAAMPMIFNALKINATLSLIGAIVAEFFGTPIVGMGFRISTEIGKMDIDMVWAEIAAAALVGSAFYGVVSLAERVVTFWHPSYHRSG